MGITDEPTRSHGWQDTSAHPRVLALWPGGSGARDLERGQSIVIGRGRDVDLQILHASVSRRHLLVKSEGDTVTVEDIGSSTGTKVGGVALRAGHAQALAPGVAVEIGAAVLVLQAAAAGLARTSSAAADPMEAVRKLVALVAPSSLAVLLFGETGVGKEVAATNIHAASSRADGPFIRVNCAAFTETLLESELFGHERGAFTGATTAREGLVEAAHGGSLFLDELGEMPLEIQAKLLRTLDNGEVRRVGATRAKRVDVRFIGATNRNLEADVEAGRFRRDLYFRLNGLAIHIPPLRERKGEIASLATGFADAAYARLGRPPVALTAEALDVLLRYSWPGNLRELRNAVERGVVLAGGGPIRPEHLRLGEGATGEAAEPASIAPSGRLRDAVAVAERERILAALEAAEGNQSRAAEILGVSRRTLINRLDEHGLPRPRKR